MEAASLGAVRLDVRPTLACYRDGERPSVTVGYQSFPRETQPLTTSCHLTVFDERGARLGHTEVALSGTTAAAAATADLGAALPDPLAPGLYRVEAVLSGAGREERRTTGFWVWDEALLAGGAPLVAGESGFTRGGEPYPVTGTTYMASDVHRKFLLLPNPWLWDRDFAEMKRGGVNLVRTGIWTGWKVLMPRVGEFREDALRALDAWLLTARRHDVPVIFTLFAFLPETWGGENAYLDPQAVEAQRAFVTAIASRYGKMNDLLWDLINEPSFCNKDHLWSCRPNDDRFERAAWGAWIAERYPDAADRAPFADLPALDDFKPGSGADALVREYRLFAQATFPRWVREMTAALRANGNPRQLVTVGQDEAGTNDSPNNLFLAPDLDFTCVHNWWLNDALVWDGVMTKAPGKMNLVEETGVMFSGRPAGIEPRWEEYARNLLERKMVISLAQSGGFVEWVWNSNCYMASDNEAAIGFLRADGTAKPELESFLALAAFTAAAARHLVGREARAGADGRAALGHVLDAERRHGRDEACGAHAGVRLPRGRRRRVRVRPDAFDARAQSGRGALREPPAPGGPGDAGCVDPRRHAGADGSAGRGAVCARAGRCRHPARFRCRGRRRVGARVRGGVSKRRALRYRVGGRAGRDRAGHAARERGGFRPAAGAGARRAGAGGAAGRTRAGALSRRLRGSR